MDLVEIRHGCATVRLYDDDLLALALACRLAYQEAFLELGATQAQREARAHVYRVYQAACEAAALAAQTNEGTRHREPISFPDLKAAWLPQHNLLIGSDVPA